MCIGTMIRIFIRGERWKVSFHWMESFHISLYRVKIFFPLHSSSPGGIYNKMILLSEKKIPKYCWMKNMNKLGEINMKALLCTLFVGSCGVSGAMGRVIGGTNAQPGAWPWQVRSFVSRNRSNWITRSNTGLPMRHYVATTTNSLLFLWSAQ